MARYKISKRMKIRNSKHKTLTRFMYKTAYWLYKNREEIVYTLVLTGILASLTIIYIVTGGDILPPE